MKGKLKIILLLFLVVTLLIGVTTIILISEADQKNKTKKTSLLVEYQKNYDDLTATGKEITSEVLPYIKKLTKLAEIYDVTIQKEIKTEIHKMIKKNSYTADDMLLIYNPFGTNTQSMYLYFTTETPVKVSYRVQISDNSVNAYSGTFYSLSGSYATVHEYQLIGLIPNQTNIITITMIDETGAIISRKFSYKMGGLRGKQPLKLNNTEGISRQKLEDGLYAMLGNGIGEKTFTYIYDNNGILRSEYPLYNYKSNRILFNGNKMYFSISQYRIAEIDHLGQVTNIYNLGNYFIGDDYIFDDQKNILVLATDKSKNTLDDVIMKIDCKTGEATKVMDLEDLFYDYKNYCKETDGKKLDWFQFNSIQWMEDDTILLSSLETSTIMKISNIYRRSKIVYMIGEDSFWKGTGFNQYLFAKDGEFQNQVGQYSLTYVPLSILEPEKYYIYMLNSSYGESSSRSDYVWGDYFTGLGRSVEKGRDSFFYKYLVDETAGTYQLEETFPVEYSGGAGSAQIYGENKIISSGTKHTFSEYDNNNNIIITFALEESESIYRVLKYDFKGFYFAE